MLSKNSKVLVTGGAKNIGAGIVKHLYQKGYQVIVADILEQDKSEVAKYCTDYFQVDFSNKSEVLYFLEQLLSKHCIVNLINNVAIVNPDSAELFDEILFDKQINVNFLSATRLVQALLPAMKSAGYGRIISIASRVVLGKKNRVAYSATKGALLSVSRTWALELGEYGITVNCISPGPIGTSEFWKNNPKNMLQTTKIINHIPIGRIGTEEDIANAVAFFLDEKSGFITGQNLYVCGGITTGLSM